MTIQEEIEFVKKRCEKCANKDCCANHRAGYHSYKNPVLATNNCYREEVHNER